MDRKWCPFVRVFYCDDNFYDNRGKSYASDCPTTYCIEESCACWVVNPGHCGLVAKSVEDFKSKPVEDFKSKSVEDFKIKSVEGKK